MTRIRAPLHLTLSDCIVDAHPLTITLLCSSLLSLCCHSCKSMCHLYRRSCLCEHVLSCTAFTRAHDVGELVNFQTNSASIRFHPLEHTPMPAVICAHIIMLANLCTSIAAFQVAHYFRIFDTKLVPHTHAHITMRSNSIDLLVRTATTMPGYCSIPLSLARHRYDRVCSKLVYKPCALLPVSPN